MDIIQNICQPKGLLGRTEGFVEVHEATGSDDTTTSSTAENENDVERGVEHLMFVDRNVDRLYEGLHEWSAHCALASANPVQ